MKKRYYIFALFFGIFILSIIYKEEILKEYALFFEVNNAQKGADVMIVLAGNPYTRPQAALEYYMDGYAKSIYLTSPRSPTVKKYDFLLDQSQIASKILLLNGVSSFGIIPSTKGGATSTIDEAIDASAYFRDRDISRIVIVSDSFHTRRAFYAFEKIFKKEGLDIAIEALPAKNAIYDESNWWVSEVGITDYVLESIKTILYLFIEKNISVIEEN